MKGKAAVIVIAILVAAGLLIAFIAFQSTEPENHLSAESQPETADIGFKTYQSEKYGFEFQYPEKFVVGKFARNTITDPEEREELMQSGRLDFVEEPFKDSVILVESILVKDIDHNNIPTGEVSTITINTYIGDHASFITRVFEDEDALTVTYNNTTARKAPDGPDSFGEYLYYYLVAINETFALTFMAPHERFSYLQDNASKETILPQETKHNYTEYDKDIEFMIRTLVIS